MGHPSLTRLTTLAVSLVEAVADAAQGGERVRLRGGIAHGGGVFRVAAHCAGGIHVLELVQGLHVGIKNVLDLLVADLTSSYKKASKKVKNKKVKPVFQSFIADMERIIELYDDGDTMFSSKEFDSAMTDMENHGKKLSDLCGFGWDIGS